MNKAYQLFGDVSVAYSATVRSVVYLENTMPFQYNISKHLANEFKFNDFSRRHYKVNNDINDLYLQLTIKI